MKKRILSIFLVVAMVAAMIPAFGMATYAADTDRDTSWYSDDTASFTITTPAQLLGFSDLIASGTTFKGKTVKLGADIDLNPNWTAGATAPTNNVWADTTYKADVGGTFEGTFDGDGHTVSGIYLRAADGANAAYTGIFGGNIGGATVKNITILNSYVAGGKAVGAIYGACGGTTNITNVYCDAIVTSLHTTAGTVGVGGFIGDVTGGTCTIQNSVFSGTIDTANIYGVGGIAGRVTKYPTLKVIQTAFYGTIKASGYAVAAVVGMMEINTPTVVVEKSIIGGSICNTGDAFVPYTGGYYGQLRHGSIKLNDCYCTTTVNGSVQALPTYANAPQPTTGSDNYLGNVGNIIGTVPNDNIGFTAIENGYPRPTTMVEMTNGIYDRVTSWYDSTKDSFELSTAQQLLGFSELLSAGTTFAGKTITLGADIDLNEGWSTGTSAPVNRWADVSAKNFGGNFNGKGNTVSGIYLSSTSENSTAVFGIALDGAAVEDLAILNSYINAKAICGGLFAYMTEGTVTVKNVYCDVDLTFSGQQGGGFMGWLYGGTFNIDNCVYAGDIVGTKTGAAYIGGFVGYTAHKNYTTDEVPVTLNISNSAFYGSVSGKYVGGILGRMGHSENCYTNVKIIDCIVAGTVNNTDTGGYCGAFYGGTQSASVNTITITDCYYTESTDNGEVKDQPIGSSAKVGEAQKPVEGSSYTKVTDNSLRGINATAPKGFVSMPEGYAMPVGVVNMVADMKHVSRDTALDGFETAYAGYQQSTTDHDIRLVGLVNVMGDDSSLSDEYTGIGFDIVMMTESGKEWSNKVNGKLPVITTVYTAVIEAGKETPTAASTLGGDYIFVATVDGIRSNVGTLTFVVKTFHDNVDGTRVYDDVRVISYDTGAVVEAE